MDCGLDLPPSFQFQPLCILSTDTYIALFIKGYRIRGFSIEVACTVGFVGCWLRGGSSVDGRCLQNPSQYLQMHETVLAGTTIKVSLFCVSQNPGPRLGEWKQPDLHGRSVQGGEGFKKSLRGGEFEPTRPDDDLFSSRNKAEQPPKKGWARG